MQEASIVWQCFVWAAPFLAVAAVWWLVNRTERIVHHVFPDLEWEQDLGWLNIRAERQARTALRWLGYGMYLMLLDALVVIVWSVEGLRQINDWADPWAIGGFALRLLALIFCLGIWVLYLGCWLMPKLRAQRERAALKSFRAEAEEAEIERGTHPRSRIPSPLRKPRTNAPMASVAANRTRRRRLS